MILKDHHFYACLINILTLPIKAICLWEGHSLSAFCLSVCFTSLTKTSRKWSFNRLKKWWRSWRKWLKIRRLLRSKKLIRMLFMKLQSSVMPLSKLELCWVLSSEAPELKSSVKISSRKATWILCSRVRKNALFLDFATSESSPKSTKSCNRTFCSL